MNYPVLLPRAPTSLSKEAVPIPAPKRRAVAVACDACRSRKVRVRPSPRVGEVMLTICSARASVRHVLRVSAVEVNATTLTLLMTAKHTQTNLKRGLKSWRMRIEALELCFRV